jgi:cytochrome c-type biogenesis protein CcmH
MRPARPASARRRAAAIAAAASIIASALLPGVAAAQEPGASLPDIEDEVMCPICGTTLELSNAPQADRQRVLIRRLIDQGRSKEEIKDALVAEYGPEVLATPDAEGFDLAAWVVPLIGLALAALAVGAVLMGRRRRPGERPGAAPEPLEPAEAVRLGEDMSRYD